MHNIRSTHLVSRVLQAIRGFFVQDALTTSTDIGPVSISRNILAHTTQTILVDPGLLRTSIEVMDSVCGRNW